MTATMLDRLLEKTVADAIGVALPRRRRDEPATDGQTIPAGTDRRQRVAEPA